MHVAKYSHSFLVLTAVGVTFTALLHLKNQRFDDFYLVFGLGMACII